MLSATGDSLVAERKSTPTSSAIPFPPRQVVRDVLADHRLDEIDFGYDIT